MRHVGQCARFIVQSAADQRPRIAHGRCPRGQSYAFVHGVEGFLGQAQAHIQLRQAVAYPGVIWLQCYSGFQCAQCRTGALCLDKCFGLLLQQVGARAGQFASQIGMAGNRFFQQCQPLVWLALACVHTGQTLQSVTVVSVVLQGLLIQHLCFGQRVLQGADAGQGIECLRAGGLQGQRLACQTLSGIDLVLV